MTDIGGIIGQKYARLHPEKIKGMVFMETPLSDAETFHKTGGMMQHMLFRMAAKDKMGYKMFVKKNMFVKMMSMLIKRKLTKVEKETYTEPFTTIESRIPMFEVARTFPKKGKNATYGDMGDYLNKNAEWLMFSKHPKFLLKAKPGMLVNKSVVEWATSNLENITIQEVGKAKHLMEEDLPHQIGSAIRNWYLSLE